MEAVLAVELRSSDPGLIFLAAVILKVEDDEGVLLEARIASASSEAALPTP